MIKLAWYALLGTLAYFAYQFYKEHFSAKAAAPDTDPEATSESTLQSQLLRTAPTTQPSINVMKPISGRMTTGPNSIATMIDKLGIVPQPASIPFDRQAYPARFYSIQ